MIIMNKTTLKIEKMILMETIMTQDKTMVLSHFLGLKRTGWIIMKSIILIKEINLKTMPYRMDTENKVSYSSRIDNKIKVQNFNVMIFISLEKNVLTNFNCR